MLLVHMEPHVVFFAEEVAASKVAEEMPLFVHYEFVAELFSAAQTIIIVLFQMPLDCRASAHVLFTLRAGVSIFLDGVVQLPPTICPAFGFLTSGEGSFFNDESTEGVVAIEVCSTWAWNWHFRTGFKR